MFRTNLIRFCVVAAVAVAVNMASVRAEDDGAGKGKGKGKGAAPTAAAPKTIQLDLSKLPPDLAKALLRYASEPKGVATEPKGKPAPPVKQAPPAVKGTAAPQGLPPGLASKPKDHPGRMHHIAHLRQQKAPAVPQKGAPPPATPKKKDKGD